MFRVIKMEKKTSKHNSIYKHSPRELTFHIFITVTSGPYFLFVPTL